MVYLSIAMESIFAMVVVGAACKLSEASKNALSYLTNGSIHPVSNRLNASAALSIEASFTTTGFALMKLNELDNKKA